MKKRWIVIIALLSLLAVGALALQPDSYNLAWWSVDSGGGRSSSAAYTLDGSAGQPDANPNLSGGNYRLAGGFWVNDNRQIYLPLIRK